MWVHKSIAFIQMKCIPLLHNHEPSYTRRNGDQYLSIHKIYILYYTCKYLVNSRIRNNYTNNEEKREPCLRSR